MGSIDRHRNDSRGASEIIGYALLVGIVALSSLLIVVYGSSLINQAKGNVNEQSAELVIQELDSKLSTLSSLSDIQRVRFDLGKTAPKDLSVVQQGKIEVIVTKGAKTCRAELALSSIRYETDDNRLVGYEAGGVFKGNPGAGTVMLTSPDVTYQDGSVDITVTNISGRIEQGTNQAILDVPFSKRKTDNKMAKLTDGACVRPQKITIKVKNSIFYEAWGNYFKSEFGHATIKDSTKTVVTTLQQSELREVANDELNNVVNLSGAPYMDPGAVINANTSNSVPAYINVSKNASNTYTVQYQPLANASSIPISRKETVVLSLSQEGVGTDAVFVLDSSGSMAGDIKPGTYPSGDEDDVSDRLPVAKIAAARSLVVLNDTDRVGLVGYDYESTIRDTDGELLTTKRSDPYFSTYPTTDPGYNNQDSFGSDGIDPSADGFNGTLQTLDAGGSTCIYCGLSAALQVLSAESNQSRKQTIIFLTDGRNKVYEDSAILDLAKTAKARNITINTVRTGGSPNSGPSGCSQTLLECVADATGGQYLDTTDRNRLREFFKESIRTTEKETVIQRTAITTNASTASKTYDPYVPGDTDDMATTKNDFLNVNDPTAPSTFEHSFAVQDGERVYLNASWYGCTDPDPKKNWTRTLVARNGNTVYSCNDPNPNDSHNISDRNVTIYLDGDLVGVGQTASNPGGDPQYWNQVSGNSHPGDSAPLLNDSARAWQQNMTQQLAGNLTATPPNYRYLEREGWDTDSDGTAEYYNWTINISSNEAIVVYNYSIARERYDDTNRLGLIYRIGRSESEARPENIINVRLSRIVMAESG